jgi:hypothetical protein
MVVLSTTTVVYGVIVVAAVLAMCLAVYLLDADEPSPTTTNNNGQKKLKRYNVFCEFTVTRKIVLVEALDEDDAIEQAGSAVRNVAKELGFDSTEIVWAEEAV